MAQVSLSVRIISFVYLAVQLLKRERGAGELAAAAKITQDVQEGGFTLRKAFLLTSLNTKSLFFLLLDF